MISMTTIWAITLRHLRLLLNDVNVLLMGFYWPVLDILVWGYLGSWIQQSNSHFHNFEVAAILGIILWQVVGRGCNFMVSTFNEELWSNNIVNLFSLPLRISEWMFGSVLFYLIMILTTVAFCLLITFALYDISMRSLISTFLIFFPPLFISGIWLGFTCLQILVTLGKRGTELGFVIIWFFLPFSGAYYPIEILPHWGQVLSKFLPMSYVFQGMREYVMNQQDPTINLIKGYAMSIIYAIIAIILFVYCFNKSKNSGLARLAD